VLDPGVVYYGLTLYQFTRAWFKWCTSYHNQTESYTRFSRGHHKILHHTEMIIRTKVLFFFSMVYYHELFQDHKLNVAATSRVRASAMLLILTVGNAKYDVAIVSSGVTFIRSCVIDGQLFQHLKGDTNTFNLRA
jgi:hypothetical protein